MAWRRGWRPIQEPLLRIRRRETAPDLNGIGGVLFTSVNGVEALATLTTERHVPAWTVGPATAAAARACGYRALHSADGDAIALACLVCRNADPNAGALLHAGGAVTNDVLATRLRQAGFVIRSAVLYDAEAVSSLSPATAARLRRDAVDAVTLWSPRGAAVFAALLRAAGLQDAAGRMAAVCLSPAVAMAATTLPWRRCVVAARPQQEALMQALDRARDSR